MIREKKEGDRVRVLFRARRSTDFMYHSEPVLGRTLGRPVFPGAWTVKD